MGHITVNLRICVGTCAPTMLTRACARNGQSCSASSSGVCLMVALRGGGRCRHRCTQLVAGRKRGGTHEATQLCRRRRTPLVAHRQDAGCLAAADAARPWSHAACGTYAGGETHVAIPLPSTSAAGPTPPGVTAAETRTMPCSCPRRAAEQTGLGIRV